MLHGYVDLVKFEILIKLIPFFYHANVIIHKIANQAKAYRWVVPKSKSWCSGLRFEGVLVMYQIVFFQQNVFFKLDPGSIGHERIQGN